MRSSPPARRLVCSPRTAVGALGLVLAGCVADVGPLVGSDLDPAEHPWEACDQAEATGDPATERNLHVFFAIDVSGSMEPFLREVQQELLALVSSLDPIVEQGGTVSYYVIGFVNDVRWFPGPDRRLFSVSQVQAAIDDAIRLGETGYNLNYHTFNLEDPENLLTALLAVPEHEDGRDNPVIIAATDAPLAEAPAVLYPDIELEQTMDEAVVRLEEVGARLHLFVGRPRDNLERGFRNPQDLGALARMRSIDSVVGSSRLIRKALLDIGRDAACTR